MKILLVGCGKMGGAMMAGWMTNPAITRIDVISPHATSLPDHTKMRAFDHVHDWVANTPDIDVAVLAVKPQKLDDVCLGLKDHLRPDLPILSVAAGKTLTKLASLLGEQHPILRAMPNTPAALNKGVIGYCRNDIVDQKQLNKFVSLIDTLGFVIQAPDDAALDALSAVSGSGPAYFYFFTELLEKYAINAGFSPEDAKTMAEQTFIGSAALLDQTKQDPKTLRANVTSPGGTTAAAIRIFEENQALEKLIETALQAAQDRARILN